MDTKALAAPFPPGNVHWRVGSTTRDKARGMALAYIDARDVMDRLDEVMGPENWSDSYRTDGNRTICTLSLCLGSDGDFGTHWVTKEDAAGDTAVEAEKGGISDAFKRAAVKWGIGRYLYRLDAPWVELDEHKRIKKSEFKKLEKVLGGESAPPPKEPPGEKPPFVSVGYRLLAGMEERCRTLKVDPDTYAKGAIASICQQLGVDKGNTKALQDSELEIIAKMASWMPPDGDDFASGPAEGSEATLGSNIGAMRGLHAWLGEEIGIRNSTENPTAVHDALHRALPSNIDSLRDLPVTEIPRLKARVRIVELGEKEEEGVI